MGLCGFGCVAMTILYAHGFGCVAMTILCAHGSVWVWVCGYDYFVGLCGFGCVAECLSVYACGSVWVWACGYVFVLHVELCGFGCVAMSGCFVCTWVCVGLGVWL